MGRDTAAPAAPQRIVKCPAATALYLETENIVELDAQAERFIAEFFKNTKTTDEIKEKSVIIDNIGATEVKRTAVIFSRLLDRPTNAMKSGLYDNSSAVSRALLDLRNIAETLEPSHLASFFKPRKIMGFIPFGNNTKNYFAKYLSAQNQLDSIIHSLNDGKDDLLKDNAAIREEMLELREHMQALDRCIYICKQLTQKTESILCRLEKSDPERARVVQDELLYSLRQRTQDLLTQHAVSGQSYLAMNMMFKNNLELIKGIDRSTNTTLSALQTAIAVAQVLVNEKFVLDQITAMNATAGVALEKASHAISAQAFQSRGKSSDSKFEIDRIRAAIAGIYAAIDTLDACKVDVFEQMTMTMTALAAEARTSGKCMAVTKKSQKERTQSKQSSRNQKQG